MISQSKLDFFIKNNINVLFIGRHGVGKTSAVKEAFNRHNLNWLYFSVSTMDPWVDFVGLPKERTDENNLTYLDLVRPKVFAEDKVEAIFLDEYNRGVDKVRNAVLELIQFKSINGKKFNNLRFVWAAINPEDDITQYDVAKLDWAQKDRFQAHITVPYEIDKNYFLDKYAGQGPELVNNICTWWNELDNSVRDTISPRRVEYILEMYLMGGDIRDVVPETANVTYLINILQKGSISGRLQDIVKNNDIKAAKKIVKNDTEYTEAIKYIVKDSDLADYFIPLINPEKKTALVMDNIESDSLKDICSQYHNSKQIELMLRPYYESFETKHNIQMAIPFMNSENYGKSANSVREFVGKKERIENFIEYINNIGCEQNCSLEVRENTYKYILENICLIGNFNVGDAMITIVFFGKLLRFLSHELKMDNNAIKLVLKEKFTNIIPIFNACLKVLPKEQNDIRSCDFWKMISAQIIKCELEEYIWIPN